MVETVNAIRHGTDDGAPIDTVLVTGDLTDNAQRNELDWYQGVVAGRRGLAAQRRRRSAAPGSGATDADSWDERYWHPDGAAAGRASRTSRREVFGYPTIPGSGRRLRAST